VLAKVVDKEAQVEDVSLVGEDVVLEVALEAEDVVVSDRSSADDAHVWQGYRKKKKAPRRAPFKIVLA